MTRPVAFGIGLALLAGLYALRAREMSGHRERIDEARMALVGRGCAMAGLDSPSAQFQACVDEGAKRCHGPSGSAIEDCARTIGASQ